MKKLLYITQATPYSTRETFILHEIIEMKKYFDIYILPRSPRKNIFHNEAKELVTKCFYGKLFAFKYLLYILYQFIINPQIIKIIVDFLIKSNSLKNIIKNLLVLSKSVFFIKKIGDFNFYHIHAHWGTTPSTMAWIISKLTGISWSFTVHRGDIEVNNMLKAKVEGAKFCRCISNLGKYNVLERTDNSNEKKINVIYMGVNLPKSAEIIKKKNFQHEKFVFASVGTFKKEKGHKYLLEAISILKDKYPSKFELWLIGSGDLKSSFIKYTSKLKLYDYVKFLGRMKINDIFELYETQKVHCVILSSIIEGIPVSLMEAMSRKVPIIATNVGAVSELINNGENGYLVESKNPLELAKAMEKIMNDKDIQINFEKNGYITIDKRFNIEKNIFLLKNAIEDQII